MTVETLETVKAKFEEWRSKKRNHQERIPETLLELADTLSSSYSLAQIAKVLSIDYTQTKERFTRKGLLEKRSAPQFVELSPQSKSSAAESAAVIFERRDGAKLRIEFSSSGSVEQLISRFLNGQL